MTLLAAAERHLIEAVYGEYPTDASGAMSFCSAALMAPGFLLVCNIISGLGRLKRRQETAVEKLSKPYWWK
ncbi:hypothetical protein MUK42_32537 [Musa troglodytarum]|uniref:Uncharacterized protein n=1 Tax=Musa troglodytarum TaxID=320322 RepID=A0A9E7L9J8_9LILI|nr:hypothetical protein MUK42_32537 [Musa troglodytarum]